MNDIDIKPGYKDCRSRPLHVTHHDGETPPWTKHEAEKVLAKLPSAMFGPSAIGNLRPTAMASTPPKTVVVLDASYGGPCAPAQVTAAGLVEGWRLVLIDPTSHLNYVCILPRLAVLLGTNVKPVRLSLQILTGLPSFSQTGYRQSYPTATYLISGLDEPVTVYTNPSHHSRPRAQLDHRLARGVEKDGVLCFNYAVYALGSRLPAPLDLWDTPSSSFNRTFACTSSRVLQAPRLERVDLSSLSSPASSSSDSANDANDITTVRTTAGREIRADLVPRKLPVFLFLSLRLLEDSWATYSPVFCLPPLPLLSRFIFNSIILSSPPALDVPALHIILLPIPLLPVPRSSFFVLFFPIPACPHPFLLCSPSSSFRPNAKRPTPPSCAHSLVPNAAHLAIAVLFYFAYVWSNTDEGQRVREKEVGCSSRWGRGGWGRLP
ncbi:hypothetical protein B0H13DRAFT_2558913 [Mycena leptocephala]|nr:hypothetical protein B0H13DRAFT_2558913 [Mycena leptocephala]